MRYLLLVLIAVLSLNCGGGGSNIPAENNNNNGGSNSNGDVANNSTSSKYIGIYTLKDHSCTFLPVPKFKVGKLDGKLWTTILEGNDSYAAGDIFEAPIVISESGREAIGDESGDCRGTFPTSQADASNISAISTVDIDQSNLVLVCTDFDSADQECVISYIKS